MAVSEIIEKTRQPLIERAEELRPMVEEYNEIQDVLGRLETGRSAPRARPSASAVAERPTRRRQGGRREEVLQIITDNPGIMIPDLAEKMGIKANYLYRVTAELQKAGSIRKEGTGFHAT